MAKKKIKILTTGAITVKSFINGPVLTPYMEDIATIFAMVSKGVHFVEVCDDGSEVRLTLNNFADDNSKASREAKKAKQAELVNNIMNHKDDVIKDVVVEEPAETKEEVMEDTVEEFKVTESEVEEKKEETIEDVVIPEVKEEVKTETEEVKEVKPSYQNNNFKNNNYNKHNKHNKNNNYKNNGVRIESADAIKVGN